MEEIKNSTDLEEKSAFLTYLLAQKSLTPEEANSHAVDLMMGAVETVSSRAFHFRHFLGDCGAEFWKNVKSSSWNSCA